MIYDAAILLLAAASIVMAILDICGRISPENTAFYTADTVILIIFAVDYIVRFIAAPKKAAFFKANIFDLIAIIPVSNLLSLFRFARIFRLAKLAKLAKFSKITRVVGILGKIKQQLDKFLHTNGFIYMLYAAGALILISSVLISYVEDKPFTDALWWSIVTCTTVGYGDISPATGIGRVIAVILMIFGIGLVSMLTGAITTFFADRPKAKKEPVPDALDDILKELTEDERAELAEIARIIKKE